MPVRIPGSQKLTYLDPCLDPENVQVGTSAYLTCLISIIFCCSYLTGFFFLGF